jgi:mannose-6-phosphate isomerase-like protein (cupin superfamily)
MQPAEAFALAANEGEQLIFGEVTILVRVSAESSGGAFSLLEEVPPMVDTPSHVHQNEDELFYVLEGEHVFEVGGEEFRLGPGGFAFGPRGIPHAQRRVVPGQGRLLILTVPGGFDGFFRDLVAADTEGTLGPEAYRTASAKFGITWL